MAEPDLVTRIQELETRYMLLERYLDELSDVVATQQQTIDALRVTVARLPPNVMKAGDEQDAPQDERPPHY
jgi:uncharacterized coiled-coil protein SlyX